MITGAAPLLALLKFERPGFSSLSRVDELEIRALGQLESLRRIHIEAAQLAFARGA